MPSPFVEDKGGLDDEEQDAVDVVFNLIGGHRGGLKAGWKGSAH